MEHRTHNNTLRTITTKQQTKTKQKEIDAKQVRTPRARKQLRTGDCTTKTCRFVFFSCDLVSSHRFFLFSFFYRVLSLCGGGYIDRSDSGDCFYEIFSMSRNIFEVETEVNLNGREAKINTLTRTDRLRPIKETQRREKRERQKRTSLQWLVLITIASHRIVPFAKGGRQMGRGGRSLSVGSFSELNERKCIGWEIGNNRYVGVERSRQGTISRSLNGTNVNNMGSWWETSTRRSNLPPDVVRRIQLLPVCMIKGLRYFSLFFLGEQHHWEVGNKTKCKRVIVDEEAS